MYRTGKSYLLNRMLLNRSGGFGVGPTINPCTKVTSHLPFDFSYLIWSIGYLDMGKANLRIHTWGRSYQRLGSRHRRFRCFGWRFQSWCKNLLHGYPNFFLFSLQLSGLHRWKCIVESLLSDQPNQAHPLEIHRTSRRRWSWRVRSILPLIHVGCPRLRIVTNRPRRRTHDFQRVPREGTLALERFLWRCWVKEPHSEDA